MDADSHQRRREATRATRGLPHGYPSRSEPLDPIRAAIQRCLRAAADRDKALLRRIAGPFVMISASGPTARTEPVGESARLRHGLVNEEAL